MDFVIGELEGKRALKLTGAIGITDGEALKEALLGIIDSAEHPEVVMDEVTDIDFCTLQLLAAAKKSAARAGKMLYLSGISESCQQTARLAGMLALFECPSK